jgi:excisionase family DNA binding protein
VDKLPENLTPAQVADYLQVCRRQIYELAAQGRIPSFKLGHRTLRIPKAGLLAAIAKGDIFRGPYALKTGAR